jgi:hypothetical protein
MIITAPPTVRSASSSGYRATVAWNASPIVARKPRSAITTPLALLG